MQTVPRPTGSERNSARGVTEADLVERLEAPGTSGFVLIGGRSRRLGLDKASFLIEEVPAADCLARRLQSVCDPGVRLVGRDSAPWSVFECVPDSHVGFGPMSGLLTALEQSRTKYAFVLATDLWNVTSDGLKSILREISMDRDDCLVDVVYASAPDGRGQPLCSVWRVESSLEVVRQRFDSGEFSLFGVLERLHSVTAILEDPQLSNVNEPQDLENFLRSVVDER